MPLQFIGKDISMDTTNMERTGQRGNSPDLNSESRSEEILQSSLCEKDADPDFNSEEFFIRSRHGRHILNLSIGELIYYIYFIFCSIKIRGV